MRSTFAVWLGCLTMVAGTGCVMKSTYDATVQERDNTTAELDRAREEQKQLARQVTQIERSNAEAMREAETSRAAARQATEDAERQRQLTEAQISRLKQKVSQLNKQNSAVQYDLIVARENAAALQELVDVYQKKVQDGTVTGVASSPAMETPAAKPFDPATIPMPQELPPPIPTVEPSKPMATPETPPVSPKPAAEPKESGWFSEIKQWIISLWRAVFS